MIAAIDGATLVFDTGPLSCFARADRLDALSDIVSASHCVATDEVRMEIEKGVAEHPSLQAVLDAEWLGSMTLETLGEIGLFVEYRRTLDAGEASTLAWAEAHGATAIVDERAGVNFAKQRGITVHGTLWLIAQALTSNLVDERQATEIVQAMLDTNTWFPLSHAGEFMTWARSEGIIP